MAGFEPCLGVHVSVAGGLHEGLRAGAALGCRCVQVFTRNQRQWEAKPISGEEAALWTEARQATGIARVVSHGSYLLNLAATERGTRERSVKALKAEMCRCVALGIESVVIHPGAHVGAGVSEGVKRVGGGLNRVLQSVAGPTRILLENSAGQGSSLGCALEELAQMRELVEQPERVGYCLDTCHLFAAGYDFRTPKGYASVMEQIESAIGVAHVHCLHLNDSDRAFDSRVDRHAHIGRGRIGTRGFGHFVRDGRWRDVPMILETPKGTDEKGEQWDTVNLGRLRRLARRSGGVGKPGAQR